MTTHAASGPVDLAVVLSQFTDLWAPRTVATMNDYDLRVVHVLGEFTPHRHPDTDEAFLVLSGSIIIRIFDQDAEGSGPDSAAGSGAAREVTLNPGQLYVVPKGVQHQPVSMQGAQVLLIEPSATVNTGDTPSELTANRRVI